MKFRQLQRFAAEWNCVLERDRRFNTRYSLYDNTHFIEHFCKNMAEVLEELRYIIQDAEEAKPIDYVI